jgi:hypothetical protein
MFVYHEKNINIILLIYVDDIIIMRNNPKVIGSFVLKLNHNFAIKDLGYIHYFLRIEVHHTRDGLFFC